MLSAVQDGLFEGRTLAFLNMRKNSTENNNTSEANAPAKGTFTDTIKIADIAIREDWQVRNKIDRSAVNDYKNTYKNGGKMPPIKVALVGGALRLVDGWHRLEALRLLGRSDVDAVVTPMTMSEARWAAAIANFANGVRLKPKDIRNIFNAYITSRQHYKANGNLKSYRDIAADLNGRVNHRTVNRWMEVDHPKIAKAMSERYGGKEEMGRYHDGEPPKPDHITSLQVAMESIDNALAEARSMKPKDRRELLDHFRHSLDRLETLPQWTPEELEKGLHIEPSNDDF